MSNAQTQIPPAALSRLFSPQRRRAKPHVDRHMNNPTFVGKSTNKGFFDLVARHQQQQQKTSLAISVVFTPELASSDRGIQWVYRQWCSVQAN
ncbi:hypothetical protein ACN38_g9289 [Penicillium nordicum]|uniref:Uncharacterized protein n=1 Tax=Penicillium nordicum TaxID=229535 RepID=A0A0M9WCP9_9EURO|nr:hypothetical protein ACN38_g9289 [Penicillium nordicum]